MKIRKWPNFNLDFMKPCVVKCYAIITQISHDFFDWGPNYAIHAPINTNSTHAHVATHTLVLGNGPGGKTIFMFT